MENHRINEEVLEDHIFSEKEYHRVTRLMREYIDSSTIFISCTYIFLGLGITEITIETFLNESKGLESTKESFLEIL